MGRLGIIILGYSMRLYGVGFKNNNKLVMFYASGLSYIGQFLFWLNWKTKRIWHAIIF